MTDYASRVYASRELTDETKKARGYNYADRVYSTQTAGAYENPQDIPATVVRPQQGPGFAANFQANVPSSEQARVESLAKSLFPNDPEAVKRFSVIDGRIVFQGKDGSLYDAEGSGIASRAGRFAANLPEMIGGIIGTAASKNPVAGGAAGATTGKALKQIAANLFQGEQQTSGQNLQELGTEAAVNLGAGVAGEGINRLINRNAMRGAEKVDIPTISQKIADTQAKTGIRLDFSQAADVPELRAWKRFAAEYPNEAADVVAKLDAEQAGQIDTAFRDRILKDVVGGSADPVANATRAQKTAEALIEAAKAKRQEIATPLYDAAFKEFERKGFVKGQLINEINKNPIWAMALKSVRSDPVYRSELMKYKDNNLALVDLAKRKIDDMIGAAERAGEANRVRLLTNAKTQGVGKIDEMVPSYAQARQAWEKETRNTVQPLTDGFVGVLSKIQGPELSRMAAKFVGGLPPEPGLIAGLRATISNQDPEAWNGLLRISLENTLDKAVKENTTGAVSAAQLAGRLRQQLVGTPRQKAAFMAAVGQKNASVVEPFFDTLELIAKDMRANSQTVPKAQVAAEIADKATPGLVKAGRTVNSTLNPTEWGRALENWGTMIQTGEAAKAIAGALSNPATLNHLKQLKRVSNEGQRKIILATVLGVTGTRSAVSASAEPPQPQVQ